MPSPAKAKGQYSTVPSDVSSPPLNSHPAPPHSGYFTQDSESTTSMLRAPDSRQHSPGPESSTDTAFASSPRSETAAFVPSPRPIRPANYDSLARNSSFRHSHFSTAGISDASTIGIPNDLPPGAKGYGWSAKDIEADDAMHNPDPIRDAQLDRQFTVFSARGWLNLGAITVLIGGLITLFAAYPIISFYTRPKVATSGFNLGGINASGQVPDLPGLVTLVDPDTPQEAMTKVGLQDGKNYKLVFSDEFNTDGRTFYPGDDPYWEAVDFNYWPTGDLEWYSPDAITTRDGKLEITMMETQNHELNFESGMLQSWNKLCFTTGILEASISLPGSGETPGFWPGFWTMGNLGRPGYGATTDGTWPYSYDSCDAGALPNQTNPDGSNAAAMTTGTDDKTNFALSYLPGQRVSACTCPNTAVPNDHPGPSPSKGRGAPEIDVIEAQIDTVNRVGQASQSFQIAPFNAGYQADKQPPAANINNPAITKFNSFNGSITQQAVSAVTQLDNTNYDGKGYSKYGFEWFSDPNHRDDGYVSWYVGDSQTWTMNPAAVGPEAATEISQRLIPEEPMSIIINFGMSPGFQHADFKNLVFPATMRIDYVRIYQREGIDQVTCDPPDYPTADYIQAHLPAYQNANLTTWKQANYTYPGNSKLPGQC